ncbi:MAG: Ig-like domain-containing protein, partial [Sulfuricurvum sp.]|nr:Ig-like domain-containing protein [Sulfuricurvum sp.]
MKTAIEMPSANVIKTVQAVGSKGSLGEATTGSHTKISVKAGEKFHLKKVGRDSIADDVIAIKAGDALSLQYADGTQISLEGFYTSQGAEIELSLGDGASHTIESSDTGITLSDGSSLVYSQGNTTTLMGMVSQNETLQTALANNTSLAHLDHYAELATGVATDAVAGGAAAGTAATAETAGGFFAGMSTGAMVGLGALGVGVVAVAAGSGGGGDTAPVVVADTTLPTATAAITTVTDNVGTITGALVSGEVTDDTSLALSGTITGTLGAGEVVAVYDGMTKLGNATVSGSTWTYTDSTLVNDDHVSYTVKVVDAAGNASVASSAFTTVIDTVAPIAAATGAIAVVDADSSTTYSAGDTITIKFSEAMDSATVALSDLVLSAGHTFGTGATFSAVDSTSFRVTLGSSTTVAASDTITISAGNVADVAGNINASPIVFMLPTDIIPPATPTISTVAGDNIINATEKTAGVAIAGVAEAGSSVAVILGSITQTVTADVTTGAYTTTFATANIPADTASTSISVTATDVSGNVSTTATQTVTIDTVVPTVTVTDNLATTANAATTSIAYTYTFSEAVTGLAIGDFTATNG